MSFGARVLAAQQTFGPVVVGMDPHASILSDWGLPDSVAGVREFSEICVSAFAGQVGFVKPQIAFYERFGSAGIAVLEDTILGLRERGTLVILDVKRGDIGSTMAAYAQAYFNQQSALFCDAITISPYLGVQSLAPAFEAAAENHCGVFVLAFTSNPEGPQFQSAIVGSSTVGQSVLDELKAMNGATQPLGSFGAVVGATISPGQHDFAINGPILVPGVGAQGATRENVLDIFGLEAPGILPAVSRFVLNAGPQPEKLRDTAKALNSQRWPSPVMD